MNDFQTMFQNTEAEESGGGSYGLIEKGTYEAEITDVQLDLNKEPARLTLEYTITQEPYVGRKGWSNYNLEGRGIGFLKKDMNTLGLDYSDITSPEDIMELVANSIGQQVVVYVGQKEWQGKMYNNFYLNELLDAPAATAPAPLNEKEQARREQLPPKSPPQQTKAPQNSAPQKTGQKPAPKGKPAPVSAKGKMSAKGKTAKGGSADIPDYDEADSIPF